MENIYFPKQVVLSKWIGRKMSCMKNIFFKMLFFKSKGKWHQTLPLTLTAYSNGFWLYFREAHTHIQTETMIFKKDTYRKPWRFHICKMSVKRKTNCRSDNQMSEQVRHWELTRCTFLSSSQSCCYKQRYWNGIINQSLPCRCFSRRP